MPLLPTLLLALAPLPPQESQPLPTHADVSYGLFSRQRLNIYMPETEGPVPVLVHIHGGGWFGGSIKKPPGFTSYYLEHGIALVDVEYRLTPHHPLPTPVYDVAKAIQFLRAHAEEYHLDPERIAAHGKSAGGTTALWLALHDDLADLEADNPLRRESTRVLAAAAVSAPTVLDPDFVEERVDPMALWHEMIPRAVGVEYISEVRRALEEHGPVLRAFSPALLIDAEDPPVFLKYEKAIESATSAKEAIHSSQFGVVMKALSDEAGHECHLQIAPSAEESRNWNAHWFLKQALLGKRGKK